MRRLFILVAAWVLLLAVPASAQIVPTGTIDANGESAELVTGGSSLPQGGWATVGVQLRGTWTGTVEFQVSIDLENWQTVDCTPTNSTASAENATANGQWNCPTASRSAFRVVATSWTSGTLEVFLRGSPAGGASSGGSGGGNVTVTDGNDTALVSAGGELLVSCADCSGSGVSHVDDAAFTAATDDIVPIAGIFDDTATDSVNENDAGALRMTANRILMANLRNAAGTDAFGSAGTAASPVLTVQGIASMTALSVQSNGANLATEATLGNVLTSANFAAAFGTAGTPDAQVLSVQGITSGTPLAGNTTQLGGTAISVGSGVNGNGVQRVTIATDDQVNTTLTQIAAGLDVSPASQLATDSFPVRIVTADGTDYAAFTSLSPCATEAWQRVSINISTATTTKLAESTGATAIYVCRFQIFTDAANDVALVEDEDADECASPSGGMAGGTTAATGWNLPASGGVNDPATQSGYHYSTSTTARDVCLITSAATQLNGVMFYVEK